MPGGVLFRARLKIRVWEDLGFTQLGQVAQLVEHTTENRGVAGSNPALAISLLALCEAES